MGFKILEEGLEVKSKRKFINIILVGILLSPIVICVGFLNLNRIDAKLCVQRMALRVNIAPTYASIKGYIIENLKPGMVQEDVDKILIGIAPIRTMDSIYDGTTYHQVALVTCMFAINNIVVQTAFDEDGLLEKAWIEELP